MSASPLSEPTGATWKGRCPPSSRRLLGGQGPWLHAGAPDQLQLKLPTSHPDLDVAFWTYSDIQNRNRIPQSDQSGLTHLLIANLIRL